MKKNLVFVLVLVMGLLTTCCEPHNDDPNNNPGNIDNSNQKTTIMFDNTHGICAVTVFSSHLRGEENRIERIPAGRPSQEFERSPDSFMTFFYTYHVNFKGISGFTMDYIPVIGKDQNSTRIDANIKNTIAVPPLNETLSSQDTLFSGDCYLLIQNNSYYSMQLLRGSSIISPDNMSETLVNSGERGQYTVKLDLYNPVSVSNYNLMVGADTISLSASITKFEAGRIYSLVYNNGALSLVSEIEAKLENVAEFFPNIPVPEAPGTPVIEAWDSVLTVKWTQVAGAEYYEVYRSTNNNPPAAPQQTPVYSTTTVFSELENRTVYYIWVKAVNINGEASGFSSPSAKGIPWSNNEVPATPVISLPIIPGINQLTVSWEICGGASSYEVYVNTVPSRPPTAAITTNKTSAVITDLENGIDYYFWVRAVNETGESGYSSVAAGTPRIPDAAPIAPDRPVLTAGSRKLGVSWQAVELAAAYEVWFGTSNNSSQAQKFGNDITRGVTETTITGLNNETTYYVWIKAKNSVGESGFSPPANAKPSAFVDVPDTPDTPAVASGNRELSVSWQAVEGALFYEVWTGTTNNSASAVKHGADLSGTSVTLTGLSNGTTYYIWIKAKNDIGTSGFSPAAIGRPQAPITVPPQAPEGIPLVIAGNGKLTVSWQAVEYASAYELWAGTSSSSASATKRGGDVYDLSADITGLDNETVYYVWIKAKNNIGTSGFSPAASGTPSVYAWRHPLFFNKTENITVTDDAPEDYRFYINNGVSYTVAFTGSGTLRVKWESDDAEWFSMSSGTSNRTANRTGWAYFSLPDAGSYSVRIINGEAALYSFSFPGLSTITGSGLNEINKTVTHKVPYGTNLNSVTPSIFTEEGWTLITTGAQNFKAPDYTVDFIFIKGAAYQVYAAAITPDGQGGVVINPPPPAGDETILGFPTFSFTVSRSGSGSNPTSRNITLSASYSTIEWYVDETYKGDVATNNGRIFAVQASAYTIGKHTLTVVVYIDGVPYSKQVDFTVTQ